VTEQLVLRRLRPDEYAAWHDLEIEEYAVDIEQNGATLPTAARAG
jgi:hypothetical protein